MKAVKLFRQPSWKIWKLKLHEQFESLKSKLKINLKFSQIFVDEIGNARTRKLKVWKFWIFYSQQSWSLKNLESESANHSKTLKIESETITSRKQFETFPSSRKWNLQRKLSGWRTISPQNSVGKLESVRINLLKLLKLFSFSPKLLNFYSSPSRNFLKGKLKLHELLFVTKLETRKLSELFIRHEVENLESENEKCADNPLAVKVLNSYSSPSRKFENFANFPNFRSSQSWNRKLKMKKCTNNFRKQNRKLSQLLLVVKTKTSRSSESCQQNANWFWFPVSWKVHEQFWTSKLLCRRRIRIQTFVEIILTQTRLCGVKFESL